MRTVGGGGLYLWAAQNLPIQNSGNSPNSLSPAIPVRMYTLFLNKTIESKIGARHREVAMTTISGTEHKSSSMVPYFNGKGGPWGKMHATHV